MSPPTITRQAVLRRAAEIMQVNGRIIGQYFDEDQHRAGTPTDRCRICMTMAIGLAAGCDPYEFAFTDAGRDTPAERLAISAIAPVCKHLGLPVLDEKDGDEVIDALYRWHDGITGDTPTDAEVLAALNATADALDQAEEAPHVH